MPFSKHAGCLIYPLLACSYTNLWGKKKVGVVSPIPGYRQCTCMDKNILIAKHRMIATVA
jgi:hypothetical protein